MPNYKKLGEKFKSIQRVMPLPSDGIGWHYELIRDEDGWFGIAEVLFGNGFSIQGRHNIMKDGDKGYLDEFNWKSRLSLTQDLYVAACAKLGINPDWKNIHQRPFDLKEKPKSFEQPLPKIKNKGREKLKRALNSKPIGPFETMDELLANINIKNKPKKK